MIQIIAEICFVVALVYTTATATLGEEPVGALVDYIRKKKRGY